MTNPQMGPDALARVRFTEHYETRSSATNTLEVFKPGDDPDWVQLNLEGPSTDPHSPDAVWLTETPSGVCFDWVRIPGSVVEIVELQQWPIEETA
jgi:hypothetical protein